MRTWIFVFSCLALSAPGCGGVALQDGSAPGSLARTSDVDTVWFAPNVGSPDMLGLFTQPQGWARARQAVGVFKFYGQQLASTEAAQCPTCGANILPNLAGAGAFDRLAEWGMRTAMEFGAVKPQTCDGEVAAGQAAGVIDLVAGRGGSVHIVSMDEPYIGGQLSVGGLDCGYEMQQSAAQTARFINKLAALHPEVRVGDIEPYPYFSVAQLEGWLAALAANGVTPAFFHLDVDRNDAKNRRSDVAGDLRRLKSLLAARAIPFGVIFWGQEIDVPKNSNDVDRDYYNSVMTWVNTVKGAIGAPDQAIFQSWFSAGGQNLVPHNLTEDAYSHTRVIDDGWAALSPGVPPPGGPPPADTATIKVRHAYPGILGRPADDGGLASYSQLLRSGMTTTQLCQSLFDSPEYQQNRSGLSADDLATALYQGILERDPDPSGFADTVAQIQAGHRAPRAAAMLDSPEFQQRFLQ